jgi:GSCFA family
MSSSSIPRSSAELDGAEAWERSLAEPHALWDGHPGAAEFGASVRGRLEAGAPVPHVVPKFSLRPDDVFFCIGSCFARVIEYQLLYRSVPVTSLAIRGEPAETPNAVNGIVSKYTTASMLNEMRWSLDGVPFPDEALVADGDGYRDLQLHQQPAPVSLARARARRAVVQSYFARLREASVVIVTLGLAEVWYDRLTELYLNVTPTFDLVRSNPGRFAVKVSDYTENRARLERICDILTHEGRPDLRIVVTVSPVPLHRTFAADDVLVVNTYAKATLRAVAGDIVRTRPNVEYFPAFELVTASDRATAYMADQVHVAPAMVDLVGRTFLEAFGLSLPRPHPEYDEGNYLIANADVRSAVVRGEFGSGYEHWLRHGRAEGRPLRP